MVHLVIDTNILIYDATILTNWNSGYKFILPDFIIGELKSVLSRQINSQRMNPSIDRIPHILDLVQTKEFVYPFSTVNISLSVDIRDDRLSNIDKRLVAVVNHLKSSNPRDRVVLCTNDRRLQYIAVGLGLEVFRPDDLKQFISGFTNVTVADVGNRKLRSFNTSGLAFILVLSIVAISVAALVYYQALPVLSFVNQASLLVVLVVAFPFLFYWIRCNARAPYGLFEVTFGMFVALNIKVDFGSDPAVLVGAVTALLSGVYVVVRGLDNTFEGFKVTILERPLRAVFIIPKKVKREKATS